MKRIKFLKINIISLFLVLFILVASSVLYAENGEKKESTPTVFYDYEGNEIDNDIVYYDGALYFWKDGHIVENGSGLLEMPNGKNKYFATDKDGKIYNLKGLQKLSSGRVMFFDYFDCSPSDNNKVHGREYLQDTFGNIMPNRFYFYGDYSEYNGLSDENGFKIKKPGIYQINDAVAFIDEDGNFVSNGLYKYRDDVFCIYNGDIVNWHMTDDEIKTFKNTYGEPVQAEEKSIFEKIDGKTIFVRNSNNRNIIGKHVVEDIANNKRYLFDKDNVIIEKEGFNELENAIYYVKEDGTLAFDEILNIGFKKYLFDEKCRLVKNGSYMISNGYRYLSDKDGIIITKPGLYKLSRSDSQGIVKKDSKNKTYFVNHEGNVVYNDFIFIDDKVYYATEDGTLLKNKALANRYYFNEKCELVSGEVTKDNVEEARNWVWYCDIKRIKYMDEITVDSKKYDKVTFNKMYLKNSKRKLPSITSLLKELKEERAYDKNGNLIKNRFIDVYDVKCSRYYTYYVDENGDFVKNKIVKIGDERYVFRQDGRLMSGGLVNWNVPAYTDEFGIDAFLVDDSGIVVEDKVNYYNSDYYVVINNNKEYEKNIGIKLIKDVGFADKNTGDEILDITRSEYSFENDEDLKKNFVNWHIEYIGKETKNYDGKDGTKISYVTTGCNYKVAGYGTMVINGESKDVIVAMKLSFKDLADSTFITNIDIIGRRDVMFMRNVNANYEMKVTCPSGEVLNVLNNVDNKKNYGDLLLKYEKEPGNYKFYYENPEEKYTLEFEINTDSLAWVKYERFVRYGDYDK